MKNNPYPHAWHRAPLCLLPSALLVLALAMLPGRSSAQTCTNLLPNPSFEAQNVSPLSGYQGNVYSSFQSFTRDELTGWQTTNALHAGYFATNAPTGSDTNPSSPSSVFPYFPLQPHTGIGMLGVTGYRQFGYADYATMRSGPLTLAAGDYRASFWVYCPPANGVFNKMGMNLTTANPLSSTARSYPRSTTSIESSGYITQPSWQKVQGIITISVPGQYYVNIGNFSFSDFLVNGSGTQPNGSYYFIDDVELSIDSGSPVATPIVTQLDPTQDNCYNVARFTIDNFDPYVTYTVNRGTSNITPFPLHPTTDYFFVKTGGGAGNLTLPFSVTATRTCGSISASATTTDLSAVFYCEPPTSGFAKVSTAYPNPASESLALPAGATGAMLLNSQGRVVQRADAAGKLDVRQLPAGLYNVQMRQNGKLVNQHIEVKH